MLKISITFNVVLLIVLVFVFSKKSDNEKFDIESFRADYEIKYIAQRDTLKLFKIEKERAKIIADSLLSLHVKKYKLRDNIDFMRLDTVKDSAGLSRRDLAVIGDQALRLEICEQQIAEIPDIYDQAYKKGYDKGKKDGTKKGLLLGGSAILIGIGALLL